MDQPYTSYQIEQGFWCIEESGVRCFLFEGDGEAMLIDAGFGSGNLKEYISSITSLPVSRLIITHADRDHIGCAEQFDHIMMHPAEFDRYASAGRNCSVITPLWENGELSVDRWHFTVVLLPGHTPGSIALLDCDHRFLIAGDCVQTAPIYMFGPGRNLPAFVHSIGRLLKLSGSYDTIYASHGDLVLTAEILPTLKAGALQILTHQVEGLPRRMTFPVCYTSGMVLFFCTMADPVISSLRILKSAAVLSRSLKQSRVSRFAADLPAVRICFR